MIMINTRGLSAVGLVGLLTLSSGCADRVIWNDHGKLDKATENREVWDTNGKMGTGDRKIWVNEDGEEVVR